MTDSRRMILLTDGCSDAHTAKTAINILRYKPDEVVALLDSTCAGKTCQEVMGVGGSIPIVASLAEAPDAKTLVIGIAPPGGKIPPHWRAIILESIRRKLNVVSGLHEFLSDDEEFARAAKENGVRLVDVRMNDERDVANRKGIREGCLRIHTIGHDCSCGKMLVSVELAEGLKRAGIDAKFVATGQTGIMIEGDGCPVDRVISDFVNGASEKLVLANQHHQAIVVEGQGTLFHPRYSCVTLGLLHGCIPDGLILCYEMGRKVIYGMDEFPVPALDAVKDLYERVGSIMHPCRVVGVAANTFKYSEKEAAAECERVEKWLGLPTCDVLRHGTDKLVQAVLKLKRELGK
jgi:uncharacterized NAD-dependent epimerase/dehydratase family protein